jgi:hypothetical protein
MRVQQHCVSRLDLLHQSDLIVFQNDHRERAHANTEAHRGICDWAPHGAGMRDDFGPFSSFATSAVARLVTRFVELPSNIIPLRRRHSSGRFRRHYVNHISRDESRAHRLCCVATLKLHVSSSLTAKAYLKIFPRRRLPYAAGKSRGMRRRKRGDGDQEEEEEEEGGGRRRKEEEDEEGGKEGRKFQKRKVVTINDKSAPCSCVCVCVCARAHASV